MALRYKPNRDSVLLVRRYTDEWQAFHNHPHRVIQPFLARGDTKPIAYRRGWEEIKRQEKNKPKIEYLLRH